MMNFTCLECGKYIEAKTSIEDVMQEFIDAYGYDISKTNEEYRSKTQV